MEPLVGSKVDYQCLPLTPSCPFENSQVPSALQRAEPLLHALRASAGSRCGRQACLGATEAYASVDQGAVRLYRYAVLRGCARRAAAGSHRRCRLAGRGRGVRTCTRLTCPALPRTRAGPWQARTRPATPGQGRPAQLPRWAMRTGTAARRGAAAARPALRLARQRPAAPLRPASKRHAATRRHAVRCLQLATPRPPVRPAAAELSWEVSREARCAAARTCLRTCAAVGALPARP